MPLFNPIENTATGIKYQYSLIDIPPALTSSLVANPKTAFAVASAPLIPESTALIGGVALIEAGGLFGNGIVAIAQTISIQMQGIDVASVTFTPAANLSNKAWLMKIKATILSSGTVEVQGDLTLGTAAAATVITINNTAAFTMSVAGGVPVTVSNQFGALALGGTITLRQLTVTVF